jgi:hypothetical protein
MLATAAPDLPAPEMERFSARFGWWEISRCRRGWRRPGPSKGRQI